MAKNSPEMEQYSRLLSHLKDSCKQKKTDIYEGFVADIALLETSNKDIVRLIENDLKYILPSMLLFSVNKDVALRTAVIKSFEVFSKMVNKRPNVKSEPWWKDMESSIIAQDFSAHLIKLVEMTTDDTWPHIWSFVISLIIHDEQVHGVAINSLLKVVEVAFKLSRKHETVLEKAYYCWNRLIDIFCVHPRIVTSQKLIELLVRPLSTNLSLKCPKLKLETWNNLVHKVGFACGNAKCKLVIEPFIDFAYLKGNDSLCQAFPVDCIVAFHDIVKEKKLYKFCVTKIMTALDKVFRSGLSEDLNEIIVEIWIAVIDNVKELEKSHQNEYITQLVTTLPQILEINRPELNDSLIQATLEKRVFSTENMKMFILAQVPVMPIISNLMKHKGFQKHFFSAIVSDLLEYFSESQNKKSQNNVELEIWDLVCEVYILWLKSLPLPQESTAVDAEFLCSLLLIPLLSKQWSTPVQRTWNSVMEYTQILVPSNNYLFEFIEKFYNELNECRISAEFAVEFCTFLSNKDKSVFKSLMPTFNLISKFLPSKDPKPLMDLLVLLENAIRFISKQDLIKLLTELMSNSNSYGQPYDLRIKTKITKLQRKLFTLKDPNEGIKEQESQQTPKNNEKEQQNGQKTRSPLMAHSNFLHRLAKAEEKKTKKRASMSSLFGDKLSPEEAETSSPEKNDIDLKLSDSTPPKPTQTKSKDDQKESVKEQVEEVEEKVPLVNGRSSPAIPSVVTVVTTPIRKRAAKQPAEAMLSQGSTKNKSSPRPQPTFFDDDAQDFVIIAPKPKNTPLTEHQKEVMSKRRADIPALYQDLSQDTQSMNSQSLKEIVTLKEIKLNDTAKSVDVTAAKVDKEEANNPNPKAADDIKKDELLEDGGEIIENGNKDMANDSEEIINDTQPKYDSGINLSLTPTKHSSVAPTQKNLLSKFSSLECEENGNDKKVDEEDEVEKENKIINIEEVANQKSSVKRRSTRKSTNRYITKKTEELSKTKTKKDISESSTKNFELTPKGKVKKSSENAQKNIDEDLLTKTKNNVLEVSKEDSDCGTKGNLRNEDFAVDEKSSETVESLITSTINVVETLVDYKENEKTDVSEILVKYPEESGKTDVSEQLVITSEDLSKSGSEKDLVVRTDNSNVSVIADISKKPSKISNEKCNIADIEPIAKTPLRTYVNKSKTLDSSRNPVDSSKISNDTIKSVTLEVIKTPEKNCDVLLSELKEKSPEKIIMSDSSNMTPPLMEDHNPKTEEVPSKAESHMGLSDKPQNNLTPEENKTGDNSVSINKDMNPNCDTANISSTDDNKTEIIVIVEDESAEKKNCVEVMETNDQNKTESEIKIEIKKEEEEALDQNSSGDSNAASWSMVTPEKKSGRKRKVIDINTEKFSPKILRSKRLSLGKETPDTSTEKNDKKAKITPRNGKGNKTSEKKTSKKSPNTGTSNSTESDSSSNTSVKQSERETDSKLSTPESERPAERKAIKRKNQDDASTPPSQSKKQKTEVNSEESSQDSLGLLKNNAIKPRKKKVIKSIMKSSPNNLEQWLIKSGKAVVKTSLLSCNEESNSQSESKIINSDSEIQISSSEPKKIIVEMSPIKGSNDPSPVPEENIIEIIEILDPPSPEIIVIDETEECSEKMEISADDTEPNMESNSVALCLSSDDEGIPCVLEPEVPKTKPAIVVTEVEDIESIERQFLEAIKRRAEEEEENSKKQKQEDNLKPIITTVKNEDDDDDDEELLAESLKCDETELDRSIIDYDRNCDASRVKLESMLYAKYKTTLRRPRRRKRLLRRVKKQDDENDFEEEVEEEEETFDARRERLTTPFRPSGGRSAQMVKMVTTEEEPPITPIRGRKSIVPLQLTENWPEGRCEQWVPYLPTPPGKSPSLGILKKKVSPVVSPTSSPNNKKKRVSFLDPPVSKGLLYSKGSDNIGQIQHANIPPGKKPIWKGDRREIEETGPSCILKSQEVDGGFGHVEEEDELSAIQDFLNSTPDAPWKDSPMAGDISKIPGILTCTDPVQNIISRIASSGDEKKLSDELQRLKIRTIGGFCSLNMSDIKKLSIRPAKIPTLYNVLKNTDPGKAWTAEELKAILEESISSDSETDVFDVVFIPSGVNETTHEKNIVDNLVHEESTLDKDIAGTFELHRHGENTDYFKSQPSSSKKSLLAKLQDDSSKSSDEGEKMDFVETQIEITTLGIEMGVQVDPTELCSDDTITMTQMSQKEPQQSQDYCLTPPVRKEPTELYTDSQEEIKIPTRQEIGMMFQSDVFLKRAAPFVTYSFLSKLTEAAADYFGTRPI